MLFGWKGNHLARSLQMLLFILQQANMNGSHVKSVWDDFENNGQETELDELDRLFRGMDVGELCRKTAPDVAAASAAVDMSGIQKASSAVEDILTKASLIEILRERERLQRSRTKKLQKKPNANKVCVFCRNNGEAETVYTSHQLKDPEGNITCPILYIYTCPICGANGKSAHTIKYCPYNTGESLSTISTLSKAIRPVLPKHIVPLI